MAKRNYSFLHADPDRFDSAPLDGLEQIIPARIGSTYWAILRVMYALRDRRVSADQLAQQVETVMSEFDESKWEQFVAKPNAKSWRERVLMNARNLTRSSGNNPYGYRLAERGYALTSETEGGNLFFILGRLSEHPSEG